MQNELSVSLDQAQTTVQTKTAPKVTAESIAAKIARTAYHYDGLLTMCVIEMRNGFKFVGKSAPASPENYDLEVGKRFAYEDAVRQIWSHEGYLLRELLATREPRISQETEREA